MSRFLLIGLDGAEPSLAASWMDAGCLPHLARLRSRGAFLPLQSTLPPATFPAWTTCVTGVNPGRHGMMDFTQVLSGQYALRFTNATHRRAPALWQTLSCAGKRVGILGVPATYPPEPVNGFMVSGFDSPVAGGIDASFVYPRSLFDEVRGWRFGEMQEGRIDRDWHRRALPLLLNKVDAKAAIAERLYRRERWDFFVVVFGESDTVSHHFWMYHDLQSPRHQPGPRHAIREVYQRLDAAVGRLVGAADEDTTVAVVSDHGFGGAGTGVVHLNNWLEREGYLRFSRASGSLLKRAALAWTPQRVRGSLFRRFGPLAAKAESQDRFAGIEWRGTTAWSEELSYFPSVRVNLRGREPEGQVSPEAYQGFVAELCARLEQWEVIDRALPREAVYQGPYVDRAPDILLELALEDGYNHSCLRRRGGPVFRRLAPHEYVGGKERGMNGAHRSEGLLIVSEGVNRTSAGLEDIAPTVLAVLGVAGPAMDGKPLFGALVPDAAAGLARAEADYGPAEEKLLEERLRSLGYFE